MANNTEISVDVNITGDGKKQIENYVKSFDSLRNSINGLSQPFNNFSNSLSSTNKNLSAYTAALLKLNEQNKETVTIGEKVDDKVNKTMGLFLTGKEILKIFKIELQGLYVAFTGGLSILVAFLPEIINLQLLFLREKKLLVQ